MIHHTMNDEPKSWLTYSPVLKLPVYYGMNDEPKSWNCWANVFSSSEITSILWYNVGMFLIVMQVCISFALHRGLSIIPKSVTPSQITENLKATVLKLDAEDMQQLVELDRGYRYNKKEHWLLQGQDADELLWDVEEDKKFVVTSK